MRARRFLTGNNVLLRRVRRYTAMPTLLRATYQPEAADQVLPAGQKQADAVHGPVVQATLEHSSQPSLVAQAMPADVAQMRDAPEMPAPTARSVPGGSGKASASVHQRATQSAPPQPESPPPQAAPTPPAQAMPTSGVQPETTSGVAVTGPSSAQAQPAGRPASDQDDDWSWISHSDWNHLKSVMAGHQEKVTHEQVEAADVQLSPEESQRIEAKKQAQAELARRQELARAGQLPRAQVVYMSPEEKAAGAGPVAEESAGPSGETTAAGVAEDEVPAAPQPGHSQAPPAVPNTDSETPAVAADESESGPTAVSESPVARPAPAVMTAAEETTPPHVTSEDPPSVGRRLLKAARSLLRRPDDDEETPAGETETGKPPRISAETAPALRREPETPALADKTSPESEADPSTGRLATEDGAPAGRPAAYPGQPADDSGAPSQRSQLPEMPAAGEQAPADPNMADNMEALTSAGAPALPARPGLQREALVDAAPDGDYAADQHVSGETAASSESAPVQPPEPASSEPEPAADAQDELETVIAPMPLQEVWPVEEKPAPAEPSSSGAASPAASKPAAPAVQRKPAGGDQVGEEVHSALQDVVPGQSTDSSIELVTPRRPRPKPPEQRISRQLGDRPPVDRAAPARPDPATGEPSTEPFMVATEIGELPSDLWGLLGERPPTSQPGQPATPAAAAAVQRQVAVAESPAVAEPPAVAESPAETRTAGQESAGLVTQRFRPPVIQRVDVGRGTVDADEGQAPAAVDEAAEPAGESQTDVDKLARQVLPEIKRRLEIDWERGRGRLL